MCSARKATWSAVAHHAHEEAVLFEPSRWIYRRAVLRSSDHSQTTDEDWVFLRDIAAREGPIPREPDGRFVRLERLGDVREKHLEHFAGMFDLVNAGLRGCRVPRGVLPRG